MRADQGNLLTIHKMIILSILRYGAEAYGSASKARTNPQPRNKTGTDSIYSAEQSAIINAIYFTSNYNQKRVIITDSLSTWQSPTEKDPRTQKLN
jgi:hypothetical protein